MNELLQDITFIASVLAGLAIIFFAAIQLSKQTAKPDSIMIDKKGGRWVYHRKTKDGHLFRDPKGQFKTIKNPRNFKGYKFK